MTKRVQPRRVVLLIIAATAVVLGIEILRALPGVLAAGPLPVVALVVGVAGIAWIGRRRLPAAPPERGSRFATVSELANAGFLTPYGWSLGAMGRHTLRLPERLERENLIVCAAPGSGKSTGLAIPALISEADRPEKERRILVIVDPKDELTRESLPSLRKTHQCLVWDPSNPDACTVGFDPLASLPGPMEESFVAEVKHVARAWFEATRGGSEHSNEPQFFVNQPRSLMEALFLAFVVTHPQGTFVELAQWNAALTVEAFQDLLDQSTHPAVHASAEALRAIAMNERTTGPIWGDILQRWDLLIDPRVCRSMSKPPINWTTILQQQQPAAVYLRIGAQDAQRLGPLLSMALGQLYREVTKVAARYPKNALPRELRVICDEFGNLPKVYGVDTALSTLRSYGVGHYLFVQNSAQITHRYGQAVAWSIQNSIVTKVILGGAALDDAKVFSERCGDITEQVPTESRTTNGIMQKRSTTHAHASDKKRLVEASQIVHLAGRVLVSTRGVMPIYADLCLYFEDEALVRRLGEDRREYERSQGATVATVTPPAPAPVSDLAVPLAPAEGLPCGPRQRDNPPPKCSAAEWQSAPPCLVAARWATEDALFQLVTGAANSLDELTDAWAAQPQSSPPELYARITAAARAQAPTVAAYVDELAVRLQLRSEHDEPPMAENG